MGGDSAAAGGGVGARSGFDFGLRAGGLLWRGGGGLHVAFFVEHLEIEDEDFGGVAVLPVLVLPFARANLAFHEYMRALAQVLRGNFGLPSVKDKVVPFGGFALFASLFVFPAFGCGDAGVGYCAAVGEGAVFGVAPEVSDE